MLKKLCTKSLMRQIIFGNHQQTARVFVDSMNDSRSLDAADARQVVPAMPEQRIDKRTAARTGRRMHGHTRRLVNHQQIGVFINDFQRNILRFRLSVSRLGNIKLINVARPNLKRIIGHRIVVTGNAAGRNQPLQLRTRNLGKSPRQKLVQPHTLVFGFYRSAQKNIVGSFIHICANKKFTI